MGSGYVGMLQQWEADKRLTLPGVDNHVAHLALGIGTKECGLVDYSTTGSIDDDGMALQRSKEGFVGQMIGRPSPCGGEGSVEGDDVALLRNGLERNEGGVRGGSARGFLQWRVVEQHLATNGFQGLAYSLAYMTIAYNAYG